MLAMSSRLHVFVIAPCHMSCPASPVPLHRENPVLEEALVFSFYTGLHDILIQGVCTATVTVAASYWKASFLP